MRTSHTSEEFRTFLSALRWSVDPLSWPGRNANDAGKNSLVSVPNELFRNIHSAPLECPRMPTTLNPHLRRYPTAALTSSASSCKGGPSTHQACADRLIKAAERRMTKTLGSVRERMRSASASRGSRPTTRKAGQTARAHTR